MKFRSFADRYDRKNMEERIFIQAYRGKEDGDERKDKNIFELLGVIDCRCLVNRERRRSTSFVLGKQIRG